MTAIPGGGPARADEKNVLRARFLANRRGVEPAEFALARQRRALAVLEKIPDCGEVALYVSVGSEPNTAGLIDALVAAGVRVLLPVLQGDWRLPRWGYFSGWQDLRPGFREIMGPAVADARLEDASFVWCAGVAVSLSGVRLGLGGGWYDRALADYSGGVGVLLFDEEVVVELPREPWDVPMSVVVTEKRTLALA